MTDHEPNEDATTAAGATMVALSVIVVIFRFYTRLRLKSGLRWDDWFILISLISLITAGVLVVVGMLERFSLNLLRYDLPNCRFRESRCSGFYAGYLLISMRFMQQPLQLTQTSVGSRNHSRTQTTYIRPPTRLICSCPGSPPSSTTVLFARLRCLSSSCTIESFRYLWSSAVRCTR